MYVAIEWLWHGGCTIAQAVWAVKFIFLLTSGTGTAYTPSIVPRPYVNRGQDPTWTYPYASRERIASVESYFRRVSHPLNNRGWNVCTPSRTFSTNHKVTVKWESVRPDLRPKVQAWYDKTLARYKAEGRELTPGLLRSLRCNAARYGKFVLTGRYASERWTYLKNLVAMRQWVRWNAEQEMRRFPRTESRQLEVGI